MKTNKILLILNTPPPYGGGEIRAQILYDYFSNNNRYLIVTNTDFKQNKSNQGKLSFNNLFKNIKFQSINIQAIIKNKPYVVYLSIPKGFVQLIKLLPLLILCRLTDVKVVGELAGGNFFFLNQNKIFKKWGKRILREFFQIRLLGKTIQDTLIHHGVTNTIVFDNGTIVPNYEINKPKMLCNEVLQLSFIGALHKMKGIYLLVEIADLLSKTNIPFLLNIVGEWENADDKFTITKYIETNNLESKIYFHGILTGDKKWNILSKTDIYLFPSYNEGQPVSIIEALAFGIPIISSNVGAIPDTIKNELNGFVLDKQIPEVYVDRILSLISNRQLYIEISNRNLTTYNERFTVEKYCDSVSKWLENL